LPLPINREDHYLILWFALNYKEKREGGGISTNTGVDHIGVHFAKRAVFWQNIYILIDARLEQ
jgi:hypothetical protein